MDDEDDGTYTEQDWEDDNQDDDESEYVDEFEEAATNCAMLPDGTCMKAGSEECDWECPFS